MKISCPTCGKHLEIEDTGRYQCPACNTVFDVEREDTAQVPGLATCPYCKGAVSPDARKCPHCGEWIKEKPKSRTAYLILAILFGNWGIAEFYAGRILNGIVILILNIICIFSGSTAAILIPAILSWIIAILSDIGIENKKEYKKNMIKKIIFLFIILMLISVAVICFIMQNASSQT